MDDYKDAITACCKQLRLSVKILFPGENNRLRESSINELFASQKGGVQDG